MSPGWTELKYDPYQLVSVAQRLTNAGLPMIAFNQSVPNLTEASSNLYELIKGRIWFCTRTLKCALRYHAAWRWKHRGAGASRKKKLRPR